MIPTAPLLLLASLKRRFLDFYKTRQKEKEREREGEGEREKENGDEESARTRAIDRSPMTKRIERRLESATLVVAFKRVASSR